MKKVMIRKSTLAENQLFHNDSNLESVIAIANNEIAGIVCYQSIPSENKIILKNARLMHSYDHETSWNIRYGLVRFALYLGSIEHKAQPNHNVTRVEDCFDIFEQQSRARECRLSACWHFPIEQNCRAKTYILLPHAETYADMDANFYVLKGSVEQSLEPDKFAPFQKRLVFNQGQYFPGTAIVARTASEIIELNQPPKQNIRPPKARINYGMGLYNSYFLIYLVDAMQQVGWFDYVSDKLEQSLSVIETQKALGLKTELFQHSLRYLSYANVIDLDEQENSYTCHRDAIEQIQHDMGYLQFVIHGYADVLKEIAPIMKGEKVYGKDVKRDDNGVHMFYYSYKLDVEKDLLECIEQTQPKHIAHIGCGSARRLIQLCRIHPKINATGIDMDPAICDLAEANIRDAGLSDRIRIVRQDVREWVNEKHDEVDLILFIGGMFHDFQNLPEGSAPFLKKIGQSISKEGYILIEDQNITGRREVNFPLSVADGFEYLHTLMGAKMFPRDEYINVFESSNWDVHTARSTLLSKDWIYLLKNKEASNV